MVVETVHGFPIRLSKDKWFTWKIEDYEVVKETFSEACNALDEYLKRKARSESRKLGVAVIDIEGRSAKLYGVHGGNGSLLTKPKLKNSLTGGLSTVYIDTPLVRAMVAECSALKRRLERLFNHLGKIEIEGVSSYRHRNKDWLALVEARIASAQRAAADLPDVRLEHK